MDGESIIAFTLGKKFRGGGRGLIFKGGYDGCTWTYKMDPKQVFPPTTKHTLNRYFCLLLLP